MKDFLIAICLILGLLTAWIGVTLSVFRDFGHNNIKTAEEINVDSFGRFKILEEQGRYEDEWSNSHIQYLVYDEATYIIYVYDITSEGQGVSISPYYCMNVDNEPEIAVYWDGMDIE